MRESAFWQTIKPLLKGLHAVRVENPVGPGTPDVNCVLGWIELKSLDAEDIPKRPDTILRVDHFTPQQRVWLLKRTTAHGACWLLMRLDTDWLLFDGYNAAMYLGKLPLKDTRSLAMYVWKITPTKDEFQKALRESA